MVILWRNPTKLVKSTNVSVVNYLALAYPSRETFFSHLALKQTRQFQKPPAAAAFSKTANNQPGLSIRVYLATGVISLSS